MPDAAGNKPRSRRDEKADPRHWARDHARNLGAAMKLYAPFHRPALPGVKLTRDIKYGPDERNLHDVFLPARAARISV